ncbi:RsiG family protein [Thalassiella azotivora]
MTGFLESGRRRVDRLTDPRATDGLDGAADADVLALRDDAVQEEADLSYVRRLLQGRLDLLRFEVSRRSGAAGDAPALDEVHDDAQLVKVLARVLAGRPGEGAAVTRDAGTPGGESERRRAAECAVADLRLSDPSHLGDDELAAAVSRLERLEHDVSVTRHRVQQVADAAAAELARRVESGRVDAGAADSGAGQPGATV